MLDFLYIAERPGKGGKNAPVEIFPKFIIKKSKDLMIRGGDFYAIWVEDRGLWSTEEQDALMLIDSALDEYVEANKARWESYRVFHMWDGDSGIIDKWHKYCQKQMRNNYHMLDETLIFSNDPVRKEDFASKRLPYPLEPGPTPAWDKIVGTLYSEEERHKIEWSIGSVVNGDSKIIQKFVVFYGAAGTGKSTVLNIMQELFEGYYSVFDSRALGSSNNAFALEAFKTNPLVAIQHDGDLSKIEDNTRINSLVSHEIMTVNEKFKSAYSARFNSFLFMGTNKPVRITDAKSGLIRRLIDIVPSGDKLSRSEYNKCMKAIKFELGGIASKCKDIYEEDKYYYDSYMPINMMGSTNDFYNFVEDSYSVFKKEGDVTLKMAWERYRTYCEDAKVGYPYSMRVFKEELKNYFTDFKERYMLDGERIRNYYIGFKLDQFDISESENSPEVKTEKTTWIDLKEQPSIFDKEMCDCPAQYASTDEKAPLHKWANVKTKLSDIDTRKVHYVKVPENHIVIDFDLKNSKGEKDADINIAAASAFPKTYCEFSKGGSGLHLHYIYAGDPSLLSCVYANDIEVKVFSGGASLRRRLTKCNDLPISTISSGLPLKEAKAKVLDNNIVKSEKQLRTMIGKNLRKEIHPNTKPSIDFIKSLLDEAYSNGLKYDVSDMYDDVVSFAMQSSHQSDICLKLVNDMHFKSDEPSDNTEDPSATIVFYDCEVFPNLFLVNWKIQGEDKPVVRMINPTPNQIAELTKHKLIGFNNRSYDNHILYARIMGYTNEQLYNLSQQIINGDKNDRRNAMFGEAYNLSYSDVYDFASAGNKMSLKKWEIELQKKGVLHIKHHELGLPWDQPVPEELWPKVAEYCDDDVLATEAVFNHLKADWIARQILADLAGMTVNDTTNSLTTRIIFGRNKKPQGEFNWRDLSQPVLNLDEETYSFLAKACPEMMEQTHGEAGSLLPYFPGYKYDKYKRVSTYRGEVTGEGGFAQGFPGAYTDVALLDIASMHPHSLIAEVLFGVRYTTAFRDIVEGRVDIKHQDWDEVATILDGKLVPYIQRVKDGEFTSKDLANALKTAINSVYGLTSAKFDNPFHDNRNEDNIVAKRGALFMLDLKHAVQEKGFKVAHIKTDSIKIPNATPEIIKFVIDFGKRYGYTFEHEATYAKMCLVNDAVYIAKYATADECQEKYGYIPDDNQKEGGEWTATGTQFAVPYVFKTLFSGEQIAFEDMCETKSVKTAIFLDKNESLPDVTKEEKELKKIEDQYKKGLLSDTIFEPEGQKLTEEIAKGHNYIFVGKVGEFTPIKPGCGGALLVSKRGEGYSSVTGAKDYRWLESSMVKELGKEDDIDTSYYTKLVDDAADTIKQYCDLEWFRS